jgi:energy-coupling factor transporter ATP-binding protein EcfA2
MMKEQLKSSTTYFGTYEAREEAFRKGVFALIPRKYAGPKLFWNDFGKITLNELLQFIKQPIAYITSNPRDCLAFGTPWQVLTAATLRSQDSDKRISVNISEIAEAFGIMENLYQPIRTLSGGETVKVSLAKSFVVSNSSNRLVISSPFSWLSSENFVYFQDLFYHYLNCGIPVDLLALEGEDSNEPLSESFSGVTNSNVEFSLRLEDVNILLGSSLNPIYAEQTYARVENFKQRLSSPCLIIGNNGQGKSLIAKALSGALSYQGAAEIGTEGNTGPPRLLFQDVITQTLLRSFNAIARSAVCQDMAMPMALYEKILKTYRTITKEFHSEQTPSEPLKDWGFRSLLEVKAILMAIRLCGKPSAIILDEPDWGLTRASAGAFVSAVISVCHELTVPVILISHKPWWLNLAKSVLRVQRTAKEKKAEGKYSFTINLTAGPAQTSECKSAIEGD